MPRKHLLIILSVVASILMIPLVAMQFTNEVVWTLMDFVMMGGLLSAVGIGIEFVLRKSKTNGVRFALVSAIVVAFFLIWIELAVGI